MQILVLYAHGGAKGVLVASGSAAITRRHVETLMEGLRARR